MVFRRKIERRVSKMPMKQQKLLANLVEDLEMKGPLRTEWPGFGKLKGNEYHCHLSHSWVACWRETETGIEIEVYYAGSREDAPY